MESFFRENPSSNKSVTSVTTFHTSNTVKVGSVEVKSIHVDHFVPGSYDFVIHTADGAVIYSGDLRVHGTKPEMTQDFVEASAVTKLIAMLCEGTNLIRADYSTEQDVNAKIGKMVSKSQNLVLAAFRHTDVDRTRTLYDVARQNHRKLAISLRQAHVLNKLKTDKSLEFPVSPPAFRLHSLIRAQSPVL